MPITNWPGLLIVCAILAVVIGGGGFFIGMTTFYDRGWRDRDHDCEQHHHRGAELARYDPADPWRTGRHAAPEPAPWSAELRAPWERHEAPEPDTAPLRLRLLVARLGTWLPDGGRHGATSPADSAAVAVQVAAQRTEFEIQELARAAEETIGSLKERVRAELGATTNERTA